MAKEYMFIYSDSEIKSSIHVKKPNVGTRHKRTTKLCVRQCGGEVGWGIFYLSLQVLRGGNFYSLFLITFSHPFLKWTLAELLLICWVKSLAFIVCFSRVRNTALLKVSAYMQCGLLPLLAHPISFHHLG